MGLVHNCLESVERRRVRNPDWILDTHCECYLISSFKLIVDATNGFQPHHPHVTPPALTSQCDVSRFPPIAAPFNPPHTGVLPTTWHNFESDLDAPDISTWMPHQISNYFAQHGFGNEVCKVFVEQVLFVAI